MSSSSTLFVPLSLSLSDDAPGYNTTTSSTTTIESSSLNSSSLNSSSLVEENLGPLCWKCDGSGLQKRKGPKTKSSNSTNNNLNNSKILVEEKELPPCKVCKGMKRLKIKKQLLEGKTRKGEITQVSIPNNWNSLIGEEESVGCYDNLEHLQQILTQEELQPKEGEQLCGLVGGWRIFQKKGGHRWTTDDIVTAWAACQAVKTILPLIRQFNREIQSASSSPSDNNNNSEIQPLSSSSSPSDIDNNNNWEDLISNYLDIGCGNGSVLMMVARNMPLTTKCIGIEARSEAVSLARRSIAFNCGLDSTRIQIRNRDFREINSNTINILPEGSGFFDLVTGTPPYFRVNFKHNSNNVEEALIRQGGMPSNKDSAPARCEFRGGIEAYCQAASVAMKPMNGVFVVCENWLNHERVVLAAKESNLHICKMNKVIGKEGKDVLFCVYTMISRQLVDSISESNTVQISNYAELIGNLTNTDSQQTFIVRDENGAWTKEYGQLLRDVLYPVASLHPSGKY